MPRLVVLKNSNQYLKIGGTASHQGPPSFQTDNNHYGTKAFVDSLIAIAKAWNGFAELDSIEAGQAPLRINDMSLPNGGKFDIEGKFLDRLSYHAYHRVGRDVDIRTTRILPEESGGRTGVLLEPVKISGRTRYRNRTFEDLWVEKGANPRPRVHAEGEDEEHYHIYFYSSI